MVFQASSGSPSSARQAAWWRRVHPAIWALAAGLLVVLAAAAVPVWHALFRTVGAPTQAAGDEAHLPWRVEQVPPGLSRVFGFTLGATTLAEVRARTGEVMTLGLVARIDEVGTLEAMVEPWQAGFIAGRLVMGFDVPEPIRARWRTQGGESTVMEGGVRRFALSPQALAQASSAVLAGLSFVPSVRLIEADLRQRFGEPVRSRREGGEAVTLAYPAIGLAATVAPGRRPVLQYLPPAAFEAWWAAGAAPSPSTDAPATAATSADAGGSPR